MQNAQNTFYITLRNRLVALNPNRTIYLRGVTRPGILVESNELVVAQPPSDVFVLRWIGTSQRSISFGRDASNAMRNRVHDRRYNWKPRYGSRSDVNRDGCRIDVIAAAEYRAEDELRTHAGRTDGDSDLLVRG